MQRKARELAYGDVFELRLLAEVMKAAALNGGKRVRVRLILRDQEALQLVSGHPIIEYICRPSQTFTIRSDDDLALNTEPSRQSRLTFDT